MAHTIPTVIFEKWSKDHHITIASTALLPSGRAVIYWTANRSVQVLPTVRDLYRTIDDYARYHHLRIDDKAAHLSVFALERHTDLTGTSGTGTVAIAVQMIENGATVVEWLRPPHSMGLFENMQQVITIHGHEGATTLVPLGQ